MHSSTYARFDIDYISWRFKSGSSIHPSKTFPFTCTHTQCFMYAVRYGTTTAWPAHSNFVSAWCSTRRTSHIESRVNQAHDAWSIRIVAIVQYQRWPKCKTTENFWGPPSQDIGTLRNIHSNLWPLGISCTCRFPGRNIIHFHILLPMTTVNVRRNISRETVEQHLNELLVIAEARLVHILSSIHTVFLQHKTPTCRLNLPYIRKCLIIVQTYIPPILPLLSQKPALHSRPLNGSHYTDSKGPPMAKVKGGERKSTPAHPALGSTILSVQY